MRDLLFLAQNGELKDIDLETTKVYIGGYSQQSLRNLSRNFNDDDDIDARERWLYYEQESWHDWYKQISGEA